MKFHFRSTLVFILGGIGLGLAKSEANQGSPISLEKFKALPVLDGGRVKPIDTYARITLLQLSAKSSFQGRPAIEWLARLMFTPKEAMDDKVFKINNTDVVYSIGLEPQNDHRYTYAQLAPAITKLSELSEAAMKIEEKKRTPVESEMVRVANNLSLYMGAMDAFLFSFPHPDFRIKDSALATLIGLPIQEKAYSYMDIRSHMGAMAHIVQPLIGGEGTGAKRDPATWTETEQKAYRLFNSFTNWSEHYRDYPIAMVPPMEKGNEVWIGPWGFVSRPNADPEVKAAIISLQSMALAFQAGQPEEFDQAVAIFRDISTKHTHGLVKDYRIKLELLYNSLDPFYLTKILFGFAILGSLLGMMVVKKWVLLPSIILLSAGVLIQGLGLMLRIAISGRPPVSNLFETFVFVAWVGALLGLILEFYNRKGFGILVGSITGFFILMLSQKYSTDGDTIGVLVAVLNSNFWLATHVVTISLGYAGFCLAGVIGHIYVIQMMVNRNATEKLESLMRMTYSILAFGLIFAFIGTVLGGVWADQSWGRFWGWDPKENGALLIVLWGAILFHAKPAKLIGPLGVAIGAILGIIVVMMAWFGINLLGVGLHSYGFTSGVANALVAYVSLEFVFITGSVYIINRVNHTRPVP
jgi:cytochrome c-type biogenesis protein CcsB